VATAAQHLITKQTNEIKNARAPVAVGSVEKCATDLIALCLGSVRAHSHLTAVLHAFLLHTHKMFTVVPSPKKLSFLQKYSN
jgi:hypothetical protein